MLIPLHSDAPIYHYPITTVGLIVVNVLLYILWSPHDSDQLEELLYQRVNQRIEAEKLIPEEMTEQQIDAIFIEEAQHLHADWRMLQFGNGLNPVQWLMANFMHADAMHLVGNMIFLWALGLVIEGKLGWWRFLLVYLLIGTAGYGLVQFVMLGADGGAALGASLPIYGILVLALLWAPLNELHCVLMIRGPIDMPIIWFALGYLVLQFGIFLLTGMHMGSEALHLIGALVAVPVGLVMLKTNMVDCENYDAISVFRGRHEMTRAERAAEEEASPEFKAKVAAQQAAYLARIEEIVEQQKNPALAWATHQRMRHLSHDWVLPESTLRGIITLFHDQQQFVESVPAMQELLQRYPPQRTSDARLALAQYMIRDAERPRQGQLLLAKLDPVHLNDKQRSAREKLLRLAEQRKADIEIEEPCEDW